MRVLVTGGAGYIGSVTAQVLLDEGHDVVVVDDLSRGHRSAVPEACAFHQGDYADPSILVDAIGSGVDACIHLAGFIDSAESVRMPEVYLEVNGLKTASLLDVLIAHGVDRFVLSSSAAVYGTARSSPIPVNHPRDPVSPYGRSKVMAEDAVLARAEALRFATLRYFNAAGAIPGYGEDHANESHLIPKVLDVALGRADRVRVFGTDYPTRDGTCVRDYIHVLDLAEAHVKALDALEVRTATICNVGTGKGYTVSEVIEACRAATGHPIPVMTSDRRAGDGAELVAGTDETVHLLGWSPTRSALEEIVSSAWAWHQTLDGARETRGAGSPARVT